CLPIRAFGARGRAGLVLGGVVFTLRGVAARGRVGSSGWLPSRGWTVPWRCAAHARHRLEGSGRWTWVVGGGAEARVHPITAAVRWQATWENAGGHGGGGGIHGKDGVTGSIPAG